ncbi:tRNA adenosine(34) deaminase TadA [Carnobacterium sp.]|uniref:tRNA adenosine(34) deaminase TadA n=1 Tax=Carnobacterium sp. TaxID=48221 RepID=UPI0028A59856|nr:tRNA adenosine(34) deaminase TadA [Carnobacterium sp.]
MLTLEEKEYFMHEAIKEAKKAEAKMEVPIGAVIVLHGEIIGRGYNQREESHDATTHAEMLAIQEANRALKNWRLEDAQLFVTLEPCPMCSGAMILSRVKELYYGAPDPKGGTAGTLMNLLTDSRFNHQVEIEQGILAAECGALLTDFFKALRKRKKIEKAARKSIMEKNKEG